MTTIRRILIGTLMTLGVTGCAFGNTIIYNSGTIPATTVIPDTITNWTLTVNIPKFDTQAGTLTLNDAIITLTGDVAGTFKVESFDAAPATIVSSLSSFVSLMDGSTLIVQVHPNFSASFAATAYDNVFDYGGTSGHSYLGIGGSDTQGVTLTGLQLTDFMANGGGTLALSGVATATSGASGAGNLVTNISTSAGASVIVQYDYSINGAPEPTTMLLMGSALVGIGFFRRRRTTR